MTIERRGPADDGGNGSGAAPPEPSHERTLSDYAKAAPQLAKLVYRLMTDTRIPPKSKAVLAGVAGYLLLPVDVMPDFIPLAGVAGDLILVAWPIYALYNHVPDHIVRHHW